MSKYFNVQVGILLDYFEKIHKIQEELVEHQKYILESIVSSEKTAPEFRENYVKGMKDFEHKGTLEEIYKCTLLAAIQDLNNRLTALEGDEDD